MISCASDPSESPPKIPPDTSDDTPSTCGNGAVDGAEECDDANNDNHDRCDWFCKRRSVCGDGIVELEEGCDTGSTDSVGCDSECQPDLGYDCNGSPSTCEWDGSGLDPNAECRALSDRSDYQLCQWVDALMDEATESITCLDWIGMCDNPDFMGDVTLVDNYCDMTVHEYEVCWHLVAADPCAWAEDDFDLSCWRDACAQPSGQVCLKNSHCDSGLCCGGDETTNQVGVCQDQCT